MKPRSRLQPSEKIKAILPILDQHYPEASCSLDFVNSFQLLIATILSAQCTDRRVNQVTPDLFRAYPTAKDFADAPLKELEDAIKSTGFYHNKAKNIRDCCRILVERFRSEVPVDREALLRLPGIGRKTANVILGNAFNIPGIAVDTHVRRVSQRLGLTTEQDPAKIEKDLSHIVPRERWILFSHQLIQHGRTLCLARKPKCALCPLREYSVYAERKVDEPKSPARKA